MNKPSAAPPKRLTIKIENEAGQTLIQWMTERFPSRDQRHWYDRISDGRVRVADPDQLVPGVKGNTHLIGRQASPTELVQRGMVIITLMEREAEPEVCGEPEILHQGEGYLIVNKPPSLPVHPGGRFYVNTLWYKLKDEFPGLVLMNRLDRETSGCMVIAQTKEAVRFWNGLFRGGRVQKDYLVLVEGDALRVHSALGCAGGVVSLRGRLRPDSGSPVGKKRVFVADVPSAADGSTAADRPSSGDRTNTGTLPDTEPGELKDAGEPCETIVEYLASGEQVSLLRARLVTGKTHQIRSTLCSIGLPVVGDKVYGPDPTLFPRWIRHELTREDEALLRIPYQALHSWRISFPRADGTMVSHEAGLPEHMQQIICSQGIEW